MKERLVSKIQAVSHQKVMGSLVFTHFAAIDSQQLNTKQTTMEMNGQNDIFLEAPLQEKLDSVKVVSKENQISEVDQFLNESAFLGSYSSAQQYEVQCSSEKNQGIELKESSQKNEKLQKEGSKNSLFHNFQKHLITLIKKVVTFNGLPEDQHSTDHLALELWLAFLKIKSHSKKVFNVIFGVPKSRRRQEELQKLSHIFQEFRIILEKSGTDAVVSAQEVLRNKVVQSIQQCDKKKIQQKCHVGKFQEFYQYLKSFAFQLREGPAGYRMTKLRKTRVVDQLKVGDGK